VLVQPVASGGMGCHHACCPDHHGHFVDHHHPGQPDRGRLARCIGDLGWVAWD
jgi:hypothetical protein